jgi:arylsulfotransferase ASST
MRSSVVRNHDLQSLFGRYVYAGRPVRPVRVLIAFLVVGAAAAAPAAAAPVSAQPELKPGFRSAFLDYTVRCRQGEPVQLTIDPPRDTRVAVGSGKPRSGRFTAAVDLVPGRAVALRFVKSKETRVYRVRCLPPDFPNWSAHRTGTPQAGWYLVTPYGWAFPGYPSGRGYAAIFDSHGVPVWWMAGTPAPFAADLLPNGHLAWTQYIANSPFGMNFEERTLDGRVVRTWKTAYWATNQHDFRLLPNGNALLISYVPRDHVDLRPWGGPKDATVMDGDIQEVDPQRRLVWAWNTKNHVRLAEAGRWLPGLIRNPTVRTGPDNKPIYDVAHVNSVELVGDLLVISARYLDAVYGIDRRTGDIVWKVGGTHTPKSLAIEGDPLGPRDFGGQHDARFPGGGQTLTVFDNGSKRDRLPRALAFRLDLTHHRAVLTRSVGFKPAGKSVCCGGARRLPGRDWVVSWGNKPWFTELSPSGKPVLAIELDRGMATYRAVPILPDSLSRDRLRRAMDAMAP